MIESLEEGTLSMHINTHQLTETLLLALKMVKLSHFQFLCLLDQFAPAVRRMRTNGRVMLRLFMSLELYDSICLHDSSELLSLNVSTSLELNGGYTLTNDSFHKITPVTLISIH